MTGIAIRRILTVFFLLLLELCLIEIPQQSQVLNNVGIADFHFSHYLDF
jgi:hypothetical protein